MQSLQTLALNQPAAILSLDGPAALVKRLQELGLIPGAIVRVIRRAPFGGPIELALPSRSLGLRLPDDLDIQVEPSQAP